MASVRQHWQQLRLDAGRDDRLARIWAGPRLGARGRYEWFRDVEAEYDHLTRDQVLEEVGALAWRPVATGPGVLVERDLGRRRLSERLIATACCFAEVLWAPVRNGRDDGWVQLYRGACLGCAWEGEVRQDQDTAAEDACDHAHRLWRSLEVLDFFAVDVLHQRAAAHLFDGGRDVRLGLESASGDLWPVKVRPVPGRVGAHHFREEWGRWCMVPPEAGRRPGRAGVMPEHRIGS